MKSNKPNPLGRDPLEAQTEKKPKKTAPERTAKRATARKKTVAPKPKQTSVIAVTGGTGFIGNHVVQILLKRGYAVRCLALPTENTDCLDGLDVEIVRGDLARPDSLRPLVKGVDGLIHLAAIYALWLKDPSLMYRINVEATRALMAMAVEEKVTKIVFTSSIAALGVAPDGQLANEDTPFNQWSTANDYVWSKYISQVEVQKMIGDGLPAVIVNPAFPFGPGDRAPTPTGEIVLNVMKGRLIGYLPAAGMNIVDVRDVAEGHVLAYEKGQIGRNYILGNTNITQKDFIAKVQAVAGSKILARVPDFAVPIAVYKTLAKGMEMLAEVSGVVPMTTVKTLDTANQKLYFQTRRAIEELGLPQTPIEQSLSDAVSWFKNNGYV